LHFVLKETGEKNSVLLQMNSIPSIVAKRQFLRAMEMTRKKCTQRNEAT